MAGAHILVVDLSTSGMLCHITFPNRWGITNFGETSEPCLASKQTDDKNEDDDDLNEKQLEWVHYDCD